MDQAGPAQLTIHDVQGRTVRRLVSSNLPAGEHAVSWNGADESGGSVPSGVYFCRLHAGGRSLLRKLTKLD